MFILIIFSDVERSGILKMVKFKKMRDVIHFTNNRVTYYDVSRDNALIKYKRR